MLLIFTSPVSFCYFKRIVLCTKRRNPGTVFDRRHKRIAVRGAPGDGPPKRFWYLLQEEARMSEVSPRKCPWLKILLGGVALGVLVLAGLAWGMRVTDARPFCSSCHIMEQDRKSVV